MVKEFLIGKGFKPYSVGDRIYDEFTLLVYTVDGLDGVCVHIPKNIPEYFYKVNRLITHGYVHLLPKPLHDAMVEQGLSLETEVTVWYLQQRVRTQAFKEELSKHVRILVRRSPERSKTVCYLEVTAPNEPHFFRIIRMTSERYMSSVLTMFKKQSRNALYNERQRNIPYREWVRRNLEDIENENMVIKYIVKNQTPAEAEKQLKKYIRQRGGYMLNYLTVHRKKAVLK